VLINRDSPDVSAPVLTADYEAGIRPLAEHLYGLGHRRLAYLEGNPESSSNTLRVNGLAMFTALHPDVELVTIASGVTFENGYEVSGAVIASKATGVLAFNDLVAMGLLNGLAERGVRVPHDVSVTGFDDIPFARFTTPPLTTASVPVVELGEQAWKRLRALIEGDIPEHNINFTPRIEVRGSTGPVPE
jgi:LacI family transcriptional regulator